MKKLNLLSIPLLVLFIFTLFISTAHSDDFSPEYIKRAVNPGTDPNEAIQTDVATKSPTEGNPVVEGEYCKGCKNNTVQGRMEEGRYNRGNVPVGRASDTVPSSSVNPNGTR